MPRTRTDVHSSETLAQLLDPEMPLDRKLLLAHRLQAVSSDPAIAMVPKLVEQNHRLTQGLTSARSIQDELKQKLEKLSKPPCTIATFVQNVEMPEGLRPVVAAAGGSRRTVEPMENVNLMDLDPGDDVLLNSENNLLLGRCDPPLTVCGETATFRRRIGGGRIVVEARDEECVATAGRELVDVELEDGDLVLWDRNQHIAYERIERPQENPYLVKETPKLSFGEVVGRRSNLDELLNALMISLKSPEKARSYGVRRGNVLLYGPPGCGKTLRARLAAAELSKQMGEECEFHVVKPNQWEHPLVGETPRRIRETFERLRRVEGTAILWLDELDAIARTRGSSMGHFSDKHLASLLAEIDGFDQHNNIVIMAATNRKDTIDSAVVSRFHWMIHVPRPSLQECKSIFAVHLPADAPFHENGKDAAATRDEVVDFAVRRLFASGPEAEVCSIRFRDSKTRTVTARELVSGRLVSQVCQDALQNALIRDLRRGAAGVRLEDMELAVDKAFDRLRSMLTIRNVYNYDLDLPQDVDVVAVEQRRPKVNPREYVIRE